MDASLELSHDSHSRSSERFIFNFGVGYYYIFRPSPEVSCLAVVLATIGCLDAEQDIMMRLIGDWFEEVLRAAACGELPENQGVT